jgi:hypothetical protein
MCQATPWWADVLQVRRRRCGFVRKGGGERVWVLLFDLATVVEATQRVWRDGMASGHLELVPNFGYHSLSIS